VASDWSTSIPVSARHLKLCDSTLRLHVELHLTLLLIINSNIIQARFMCIKRSKVRCSRYAHSIVTTAISPPLASPLYTSLSLLHHTSLHIHLDRVFNIHFQTIASHSRSLHRHARRRERNSVEGYSSSSSGAVVYFPIHRLVFIFLFSSPYSLDNPFFAEERFQGICCTQLLIVVPKPVLPRRALSG